MQAATVRSSSLPVGAQCETRTPISCAWYSGRPWWPECVMSAMPRPGRSVRNGCQALRPHPLTSTVPSGPIPSIPSPAW